MGQIKTGEGIFIDEAKFSKGKPSKESTIRGFKERALEDIVDLIDQLISDYNTQKKIKRTIIHKPSGRETILKYPKLPVKSLLKFKKELQKELK